MTDMEFRSFEATTEVLGQARTVRYCEKALVIEGLAVDEARDVLLRARSRAVVIQPLPRSDGELAANPVIAVVAAQPAPEPENPHLGSELDVQRLAETGEVRTKPPAKKRAAKKAEFAPREARQQEQCAACGLAVDLMHHPEYGVVLDDHVGVNDELEPTEGQCCVGAGDAPTSVKAWVDKLVARREAEEKAAAAAQHEPEPAKEEHPLNGEHLARVKSFAHVRELLPYLFESGFKTADSIVEECKRLAPEVPLISRMADVDDRVRRALAVLGLGVQ